VTYTLCLLLQMGGTAYQGRSGNLWKLQRSALDPNEGPRTAAAVPRESPVYAVQPVNRGEVPRILGELAAHTCIVPNTGSPQGLHHTSLGAVSLWSHMQTLNVPVPLQAKQHFLM